MAHLEENIRCFELFIDELGTANTKDTKSELYIVAGCMVNTQDRPFMKIWADHIKFKYWGSTDIVFHSREIGRREGDFKILKKQPVYNEFLKDLGDFLKQANFKMFFVIIDKEKARKLAWNDVKIYTETSNKIVKNFLLSLIASKSKGKIVVESATAERDFYLHKAAGHFLAEGIKKPEVNFKEIQNTLTSISFVTKKNHDIEEQISDLLAYAAKCKFFKDAGKKIKIGRYEEMVLKVLKSKTFTVPIEAKKFKKIYFDKIDPFLKLPKNKKTGSRHHARSPVSSD